MENNFIMEIKKVINPKNIIFSERNSIRKYDKSVKISREELADILQDATTAPSSLNLQPWRFFIFDTEKSKKEIKPYMMFNQVQTDTASAIIAVYGDLECFSNAEKILSANVDFGLMSSEDRDNRVAMINEYKSNYTPERLSNSIMLDCGMLVMQIMLSAKAYGYDTNPIGGFSRNEITKYLNIDEKRYFPALLISIGKADEQPKPSVRFSVDEIIEWR